MRVGLIRGWDLQSGGVLGDVIHGFWAKGKGEKKRSNWIQSLSL